MGADHDIHRAFGQRLLGFLGVLGVHEARQLPHLERETRETLEWAIRNGAVSQEVLEAIAADPVPVVTSEDIASLEKIIALDERRKANRN